jgi:Domain of unknown function (DUF4351)
MGSQTTPRADQDSPWKLILRQYFREAIEFFFPDIAKAIDWCKPIEFLDKEFQQITPDAELGRRFVDQLVKVHRKRGQPLILLLHLEVQAAPEKIFPERMFIYAVRIFEYFHQPPVSLAILCDAKSDWRPHQYRFTTLGSSLQFNFTAVKLLDYQTQWSQLETSQNVFAIVVMAHLKTQETKRNAGDRKAWKFTLVKQLYERGYNRSDVLNLFKFVDWLMILPEGLKRAFWEELKTYEEECKMPYMTSVEQIGYDRGKQEGKEEGKEEEARLLVSLQLEQKLGDLSKQLNDRINRLSSEQLKALAIALLSFESIADLTSWLEHHG